MSYETYINYINSNHWRSTKLKAFARFGWRCQCCNSREKLEGHHLIYRTPLNAGLVDDVLPVCKSCHSILHNTPSIENGYKSLETVSERRAFIIAQFKVLRVKNKDKAFPNPRRFHKNKVSRAQKKHFQECKESRLIRENESLKSRQRALKANLASVWRDPPMPKMDTYLYPDL